MSLVDAIISVGEIPGNGARQSVKKRYSELISKALAQEVAAGLRDIGFRGAKPLRGEPGEKPFYGGLGGKRVDVSYSDERHGLILAVSIKSICFPPYGKNLKNRFGDLCTEAIGLHMRFPYAVVGMLFAFPEQADLDKTKHRRRTTFLRAARLLATLGGRRDYTDANEKFENITLLRFRPATKSGRPPAVKLFDASTEAWLDEKSYFVRLRELHDRRNPHAPIGESVED